MFKWGCLILYDNNNNNNNNDNNDNIDGKQNKIKGNG